ncbi:Maf family protein [Natribacillus halophilus]|uniref:dTTP/UTP pyrophosphatase n=1 Tax=Natribacillus halophilus TaxID=549003 RepID=A0A1G8LRM3_9BACI|nr:Maf family protein [Natribacillus halophilus]SDI58352.1 septum formation protein [Natribacillus halophilus]
MDEPRLILASVSARRQQLLSQLGYAYRIDVSHREEPFIGGLSPEDNTRLLATGKAEEVERRNPRAVVLGADTIVALDNAPLGKPADESEAIHMLTQLSGRTHDVYTSVFITNGINIRTCTEKSTVHFHALEKECIQAYVETGEPMDKAGAYGIQGKGALFVETITGDYYNIVGLPVFKVTQMLAYFHIYPQWVKK